MKPDWDKLSDDFADSKFSGVYDVDCTADGKDLCDEVGVQGYPTIKYGDASDMKALKDYSGGRDYEALKEFAEANLGPVCSPDSLDICEEEDRKAIESFMKEPAAELAEKAKKLAKTQADEAKKLAKKQTKMADRWAEYYEDRGDHDKAKVKAGDKKHAEKTKKLDARKDKLKAEEDKITKEEEAHKDSVKKSNIKLMQTVVKANAKKKTEL